ASLGGPYTLFFPSLEVPAEWVFFDSRKGAHVFGVDLLLGTLAQDVARDRAQHLGSPLFANFGCLVQVFPEDPRMPSGNPQHRDGGPPWVAPPLLPIAQGANADPHGTGEFALRQPDKASQCGDIRA